MARKKSKKAAALRPGELLYAANSLKPGITRVQAAREAGLDYVPSGARITAARQELVYRQLELADITAEKIVLELGRIAFSDPGRMFDHNGNMIPIDEMDEDTRRAISGFDVEKRTERHGDDTETYYVMKPRFWNKNEALNTLSRLHYDGTGKLKLPTTNGGGVLVPERPVLHVHFVAPKQLVDGNGESN